MAQQCHVRWRKGERRRIDGGNIPHASSSGSSPLVFDNLVPMMFNWRAQYMAETPAMVQSQIAAKEIDLLQEYEARQGIPLAANILGGLNPSFS